MRVTQKDIARKLGVSPSLVSRALAGRADVIGANAATVRRIQRQAAAMGYVPSAVARQLRGAGTPVIGLVAADLEDPFFGPAAAEAVRQFHDAGYAITLAGFTRRTPNEADIRALLEQELRALLVLGGGSLEWVKPFQKRRLPIVRIGVGRAEPGITEIRVDEEIGFGLVVEHLLKLGHREFAFIGAKQEVHARRRDLVQRLLARRGLKLPPARVLLPDADVYEAGLQGGEALARAQSATWPTAIICSSDAVALGALRGVAAGGWRVPEHVSVTGFDDLSIARLAHPPLTTVRQPLPAMVADALRIVREGAPRRPPAPHAPTLVARASTAFPWRT
jgi:LacI family transcriptional regulator